MKNENSDNLPTVSDSTFEMLKYETELIDYDWRMASAFAKSGVSGAWKTRESIFTAIQVGRSFGMKPVQSLRNLYPLNGAPHLYAQTAMGLVLKYADEPPNIEHEEKGGKPYKCTISYLRSGKTFSKSFSIDDANSAGLIKKGGAWTTYTENMLEWRAGMFCARIAFPDILAGVYSVEEIENRTREEIEKDPPIVLNPVSAEELTKKYLDKPEEKEEEKIEVTEVTEVTELAEPVIPSEWNLESIKFYFMQARTSEELTELYKCTPKFENAEEMQKIDEFFADCMETFLIEKDDEIHESE